MTLRAYQTQVVARSRKQFGRYWDALRLQAASSELQVVVFKVLRALRGEARRLTQTERLRVTQALLGCLSEALSLAHEWNLEAPSLELTFSAWRKTPVDEGGSVGRRAGLLLADLALDVSTLLRVESRARLERSRVELSPYKLEQVLLNLGRLAALLELVPEEEIAATARTRPASPALLGAHPARQRSYLLSDTPLEG